MAFLTPTRWEQIVRCYLLGLGVVFSCWLGSQGLGRTESTPACETLRLVQHRQRSNLNHLYQFDRDPLDGRTPLVMLPGRAEEYQHNAWWKTFHQMLMEQPELMKRFKPYVYIYDSNAPLFRQVSRFVQGMTQTFGPGSGFPTGKTVVLLSYSLGGVIAREAMLHPQVDPLVSQMIALGVPFHGSPIFNGEWFTDYIQPVSHSPFRRLEDRFLYRFYMFNKSHLISGLRWDNFDQSFPRFSGYRTQPPTTVYVPFWAHPELLKSLKKKTIVYAAYLQNRYTDRRDKGNSLLAQAESLPYDLLVSIVPLDFISVHSVCRYTNRQLSNLPTELPETHTIKNTHLYRYNDGVVPVSSALFLPSRQDPYDEPVTQLMHYTDTQDARVFSGIDHMELGQYLQRRHSAVVKDLLHPKLDARTPNDWVFYDLLRFANRHATLPTQPLASAQQLSHDSHFHQFLGGNVARDRSAARNATRF